MFFRRVLLLLFGIVFSTGLFAQKKEDYKQPRVLILLDGSSSMLNEWTPGKKRFEAAGDIILRLMDSIYSINAGVEFSLRLYGHQHTVPENNCYDTRREVMFSKNNYTQMSLRLSSLHPLGVSPIAYSLQVAAENDFVNEQDYTYSLVLITDGGESCGGDICDVVQKLLSKKIQFKPYIVSLVDYAPLKQQYDCLGNYLLATKPSDVTTAVHTIADTYRKILSVPVAKPKLQEVSQKPVTPQKVLVPPVKIQTKDPETTVVAKVPEPKPAPVATEPEKEKTATPTPERPSNSKIKVDNFSLKKEDIRRIPALSLNHIRYPLFWSAVTPKKRPVQKFPLPAREPDPVVSTPVNKPTTQPATPPKQATIKSATPAKHEPRDGKYTVQLEPAAETMMQLFFTDGKGKFYQSTPPVQLLDKTGNQVKKFYRTVDANGNPDPQKIPPGTYTLLIGKTGNYRIKDVVIEAANNNKVMVVAMNGTLKFRYDDNPDRPVKEYIAQVRKTFEAGTTFVQKCTEERELEPGNYHIEINTLPMMVRNIDLEFGWSYIIDIQEPGILQFTNQNAIGKVTLWAPLGDQFARFHIMDVPGNPNAQQARLQPGIYEVHWKRNPTHPNEPDVIQKFFIKSNQTTQVELQ